MRAAFVLLGVFAFVSACDSHPRQMREPEVPPTTLGEIWGEYGPDEFTECHLASTNETKCLDRRLIKDWGQTTYASPPTGVGNGYCPLRVRVTDSGVYAEAMTTSDLFESAPHEECVPDEYAVGRRRAFKVDDGYIVAYSGPFNGSAFWEDETGTERRFITRARLAGFVRAPSGTILALGIGQARLGRGGIIALDHDHDDRGVYIPRLVATLPLEPSAVAFDDGGKLLTFAQGFVVRVDETGKVENLHYFAHDLGKVASILRGPSGDIYVGVDCGVIRLTEQPAAPDSPRFREEWWSPMTGGGGSWAGCPDVDLQGGDGILRVVTRVIR